MRITFVMVFKERSPCHDERRVLWVKLVFVVSAVAILRCIIIIAHLHGSYCAFRQILLYLCSL